MAKKETAKTVEKTVNTGFIDSVEALEAKMKADARGTESIRYIYSGAGRQDLLRSCYGSKQEHVSRLQNGSRRDQERVS